MRNGTDEFYEVKDPKNPLSYTYILTSSFKLLKYCTADIYLSSELMELGFNYFSFNCMKDTTCVIVQNSTILRSNIMNMRASGEKGSLSVNFVNLKIDTKLNYLCENQGAVYIHNLEMPNGDNGIQAVIDLRVGTVVLQTT